MHISELRESKYLKKEDCGSGITLTIAGLEQQNLAKEGEPEEWKYILTFQDCEKPLVLNTSNAQIIAAIVGSEETDDWSGHQIEVYHDKTIMFRGKVMGGIRVREPGARRQLQSVKKPGPPQQHYQKPGPPQQQATGPRVPTDDDSNPFD